MLLIHDLGEINADDKIIYSSETAEQKSDEENCVNRLLNMLPESMHDEYLGLWREFVTGATTELRIAKAVDRVPPLLHNIHDDGHGWEKTILQRRRFLLLIAKEYQQVVMLFGLLLSYD